MSHHSWCSAAGRAGLDLAQPGCRRNATVPRVASDTGQGAAMNKKMVLAWVLVFVAWMIGSFVVHGVLLRADYMQLTTLFRTDADQQKYFPVMLLAHVVLAGAFVWIYARGVEAKPWLAQGIRF